MVEFPPDSKVLELCREPKTKEKGFTTLVHKYQERLYWHIRRMVIHHEDADDLLQNVFIKVWRHLDGFREESALFTWLYRIATNECINFLQKKGAHRVLSMDHELGNSLVHELRQEESFDANKLEWKLQEAILQLPDKQRLVFNLRYFDEMPYEKMSKILDTSEGALKASYHHAAKKIEQYIRNFG